MSDNFFKFYRECMTAHSMNTSIGQVLYVPLISADYTAIQPFGYITCVISFILALISNYVYIKFSRKRPQRFLWAIHWWSNCLFLFQLMLNIDNRINRLQIVIAVFHDGFELYMTYWNFLYLFGYIDRPERNALPPDVRVTLGHRIFLWGYFSFALTVIVGQLLAALLIGDLKWGLYAFYLITVGDSFFLGTGFTVFYRRLKYASKYDYTEPGIFGTFIALVGHTLYALNNVLTCQFRIMTAIASSIFNTICIGGVAYVIWYNSHVLRVYSNNDEDSETLPHDYHF